MVELFLILINFFSFNFNNSPIVGTYQQDKYYVNEKGDTISWLQETRRINLKQDKTCFINNIVYRWEYRPDFYGHWETKMDTLFLTYTIREFDQEKKQMVDQEKTDKLLILSNQQLKYLEDSFWKDLVFEKIE